ncbi:hypothetical protein [Acidimangrovimonas pyrenivorans]|uniref:Uncharacterized protein n=1 Tax=Acidimangrovimonas pyrenivorans TaxID=2030798 RepID=A0ABV7ADK9_9RHOB
MNLASRIAGYACPACGAELPFRAVNKTMRRPLGGRPGQAPPLCTCPGCGARVRIADTGAQAVVKFLLLQAPVALAPPLLLADMLRRLPVFGSVGAEGGHDLALPGLLVVLPVFLLFGLLSRRFTTLEVVP